MLHWAARIKCSNEAGGYSSGGIAMGMTTKAANYKIFTQLAAKYL
jgi:hypothetical protein